MSMKGKQATRELCVGDTTDEYIWFEVCDSDAEDFRFQYAVPRRHHEYSEEQLSQLESLDESDRGVYEVTLESVNERGTAWRFVSMEECRELPSAYKKNRLDIS